VTPDQITEWSRLGVGVLFGLACLWFLTENYKLNSKREAEKDAEYIKRLEEIVTEKDAQIARYDSTVNRVTDSLLEAAEAMTASRIDAAWERREKKR